jgi:hypothetical protein
MALKWWTVRDNADALLYCTSIKQRADAFTKPPPWGAIQALLGPEGVKSLEDLGKPQM